MGTKTCQLEIRYSYGDIKYAFVIFFSLKKNIYINLIKSVMAL